VVKYIIAKKCLDFSMPWSNISKYLGASILMALTLCVFPAPIRLLTTIAVTLLGGFVYLFALSAIDSESRNMAKFALWKLLKILKIS
jgi:hypothetical protein